jgi:hypothetical protein
MDSKQLFLDSLLADTPPAHLSPILKSLWFDAKGDWQRAHDLVDQLGGQDAAWVHAYLHRKEGDIWNSDYWYARAKKVRPDVTLEVEWESLVNHFA